jgi:integrase
MSTDHSTESRSRKLPRTADMQLPRTAKGEKPAKPYPEFPLTAHPAGYWCKKIRGKIHYFGPWEDPQGALDKYLAEKDELHSGKTPRVDPDALTVKDLANAFLNAKQALLDTGELTLRTWGHYKRATDVLVKSLGKARLVTDLDPRDFAALRVKLAREWGPVHLSVTIQRIRSVFKYGFDAGLIDRPVRFGPDFKGPSKKTLRIHRARQGAKLFTADKVHRLIDAAGQPLRAMLLLGINCGYGNTDCGRLPLSAVDLDAGVIDFARPKTGVPRRCVLWPETVQAIRDALAKRPTPKKDEHAGLVFLTQRGDTWTKEKTGCPVVKETTKLLRKLGINGRKGLGFYTLRHTFRTVADEAKDQPAADYIMGHCSGHISEVYRETISDARLRAVTDHVRTWLFGGPDGEAATPAPTA